MSRPTASSHRSHGFTIIEVMVVVAIIVILLAITVSVGMSVKANAAGRSTHTTLKALEGMMKDYLATGGAEPAAPSPWPYPGSPPPPAYLQTSPASDPINWLKLLQADPRFAKQIVTLKLSNDGLSPTPNNVILDAFGTPIRYVPFDPATRKEGYFVSAGPDRQFVNPATPPSTPLIADDLYSYDP